MCDCPTTGVFTTTTTHETHHTWIIFKGCKNNGSVVQAGIHNTIDDPTTSQPTNTTTNPDTNLLFESLDPPLRPGRPDPTLPNSLEIYEEHKRTAQEYWEVQEQLVYLTQRRNLLLKKKRENNERKERIQELQNMKQSFLMARQLLRDENETRNSSNPTDQWVLVPRAEERLN